MLFDYFQFAIADDFSLIGIPGRLRTHRRHRIDLTHVRYHRDQFLEALDA